jgi:hypothetical protein
MSKKENIQQVLIQLFQGPFQNAKVPEVLGAMHPYGGVGDGPKPKIHPTKKKNRGPCLTQEGFGLSNPKGG